jgi:hypothetical protein
LTEIREELDALGPDDFDDMNEAATGPDRLHQITDELVARDDPESWMPLLFALMERLDGVDLGSPGPIVHALERTGVGYHPLLAESVRRKPTPLTIWMVNRVLNGKPSNRDYWIQILEGVQRNPVASSEAREESREFLAYQRSGDAGN